MNNSGAGTGAKNGRHDPPPSGARRRAGDGRVRSLREVRTPRRPRRWRTALATVAVVGAAVTAAAPALAGGAHTSAGAADLPGAGAANSAGAGSAAAGAAGSGAADSAAAGAADSPGGGGPGSGGAHASAGAADSRGVGGRVVDLGPSRAAGGTPCRGYEFTVAMTEDSPAEHQVYGELCTRGRVTSRTPLQILLHGGTYDHAYWDWPFQPRRYSYVEQATRQGFATLNLDRLGYGRSDHPDPNGLDFAVHGYVTHQIVRLMDARFRTIVLNGHSMGGITAEHAAARGGVDAVIISGLAADRGTDRSETKRPEPTFHPAEQDPQFADAGLPPGYLTSIPGTRAGMFLDGGEYDPAIVPYEEKLKDTVAMAELRAVQGPPERRAATTVPTLYVLGRFDLIACGDTGDCRTDPAASTTDRIIDGAGHSLNTGTHAGTFYRATFSWLARLGIRG